MSRHPKAAVLFHCYTVTYYRQLGFTPMMSSLTHQASRGVLVAAATYRRDAAPAFIYCVHSTVAFLLLVSVSMRCISISIRVVVGAFAASISVSVSACAASASASLSVTTARAASASASSSVSTQRRCRCQHASQMRYYSGAAASARQQYVENAHRPILKQISSI